MTVQDAIKNFQTVHQRAFPSMARMGVLQDSHRRGGKVSLYIASRVYNPSPFVQTYGSLGLLRQTVAHRPANFVG